MRILPTLADRVWFAYHCLPRDENGRPPSYRKLEEQNDLPDATFSRTVSGERTEHRRSNFDKLATALHVNPYWLDHGGDDGPVPSGPVPPRPGMVWMCHGELPGWRAAVDRACADAPPVPLAAFKAGANMPVLRMVDFVTPEMATHAAGLAWETSTFAEKKLYEDQVIADAELQRRAAGKPMRRVAK